MAPRGLRDFQTPLCGKGSCANQVPNFIRETGCCINQVSQHSLAQRSTRDLIVTPSGHAVIPAEQWHDWYGARTRYAVRADSPVQRLEPANLRILEIDEIKTVPHVPLSHPFVERLIGTVR